MKLFYYRMGDDIPGGANFGDDLNPWLWGRLLPDFFDDDPSTIFSGIGTILNEWMPKADRTLVFGSGVGYGTAPIVDESWEIHCVRGPLSAKALGVDEQLAVTDPAVLVRDFCSPRAGKGWGFIPNIYETFSKTECWRRVCERVGLTFIDPRWEIERVLELIGGCEVLLCEAMHGAIVADALRIPWIPIASSKQTLPFKWQDWAGSLKLEYVPKKIHHPVKLSDRLKERLVAFQFRQIIRNGKPQLSSGVILENRIEQLYNKIQLLGSRSPIV